MRESHLRGCHIWRFHSHCVADRLTPSHFLQPFPCAVWPPSVLCRLFPLLQVIHPLGKAQPASPSASGICWMRHEQSGPVEHSALENNPRKHMHALSIGNALLPGAIKQLLKVYFWLGHLKYQWSFSVNSHERNTPSFWPVTVKQLLYLMKVCGSLVFFSHKIQSKNMIKNNASFSENCKINNGIDVRNFYTDMSLWLT